MIDGWFHTCARTAKPTNLPRGSFSKKREQFTMRRGDLSAVRILLTNETKSGIQDRHDQPNVEYRKKGLKESVELRLILRGFS
jgi:hypothetical protein